MLPVRPFAAEGLAEAARRSVLPCVVLAVLLLLLSLAVPVRARRVVVSLAALALVVGLTSYIVYLPDSA